MNLSTNESKKLAVILVGHGGVPRDCPRGWVPELKRLESQRRGTDEPPSQRELELDRDIRNWPRTPENDPYKQGLEKLANSLRNQLNGVELVTAYNEFCAPSLPDAVKSVAGQGKQEILVIPTMFTPGGSHSEIEIPEQLEALRQELPQIQLRYVWPFNLDSVAEMFVGQMEEVLQKAIG